MSVWEREGGTWRGDQKAWRGRFVDAELSLTDYPLPQHYEALWQTEHEIVVGPSMEREIYELAGKYGPANPEYLLQQLSPSLDEKILAGRSRHALRILF
ncbi:MAG: hypothetical protein HC853_15140, partial [Anaerolineae bacterium]|nr:hypothetical protein [Anaerolineae bacterium]